MVQSEIRWPEEGTQEDGERRPYKALAPLLEDLKSLGHASYQAESALEGVDRKSKAMKEVDPLLDRVAQLDRALNARLSGTNPSFLPPELRTLVTDGAQTTGRLLGLLLAQYFTPFESAPSVKQLGGLMWPETWPRNAGNLLSTIQQMGSRGVVVASLRFERDPALEVDLDCTLRPSPLVLEAAIRAMDEDIIGHTDIRAMKRKLEGALSSSVPVPETTCGRCGGSSLLDGSPCPRCRA